MAKILKFTPKAHLDTETLDRMAAVAAERFRSLPSAIRKGQEPPSQMVCGLIKGAQAADVARWLYQNLTLPKKQFAEFRKVVTDAGIANNITGGTALDALIERTVATQKPTLEAIAERFGATLVEGEVSGAEDVADELEARDGTYDGVVQYARTKRAQVVLNEIWPVRVRRKSVTFYCMHPGWADTPAVETSLPRFHRVMRPLLRTPEQGADTIIWLAMCERIAGETGRFWFDREPRRTHFVPWTRESGEERRRLWELCERLSGIDETVN